LANVLDVKQQTVSRWEAGTHRPSEKQLPVLAGALKLNVGDLRLLLGDDRPAGQSFTRPLPLEALAPDTFEQFVADLVQAEHPAAQVRRAGKTGHKQDGLDVQAIFENGDATDIQCKRLDTFGEAKVKAAVNAYKGSAKRQAIALSRVASPAADAAARAAGWEMWDQDDLSRRLRRLSPEKQDRLVDTYFRGQRRELLGRDEPGPWRTTEEFFRPFTGKPVFNHDLPLIGREDELAEIVGSMRSHTPRVTIVVAPGGMGKSRILKSALDEIQGQEPASTIRFLSGSAEATRSDLESLGAGSKILVMDDAHDRTSLASIFEYAADDSRQVRVVIATRPYALQRIKGEAARFGTGSPSMTRLDPLSMERLTAITARALEDADAPKEWASGIVRASGRSPLIATMAARVVATRGIAPELAKNDDELRNTVMDRFTDVLSANLASPESRERVLRLLEMVALVQPFDPQSRQFIELAQTLGLSHDDVSRAVKRLAEGGVLLERGAEWRLMPDVLGDYIIENSCIDASGKLSAFALQVLDALSQSDLLKNVLLNLGRMDWRVNDGDTATSALLSQVWRRFDDIDSTYDHRLEAIKSIAIYQPKQTIDFILGAIHRGHLFPAFAEMLQSVFYSGQYTDDTLELLWELGRNDRRETGPNPGHPIRVLAEIAGYGPENPVSVSKKVLDFAFVLAEEPKNWEGCYTPLELMKPALAVEGHTTRSTGRAIQMTPFYVNYDAVSELRKRVIDFVLQRLVDPSPTIAAAGGDFLQNLLQSARGLFNSQPDGDLLKQLNEEFADTLTRLKDVVSGGVRAEVFVAILRAVDWLAEYGAESLKSLARQITDRTPDDVDFQLRLALLDGHGQLILRGGNIDTWEEDLRARLDAMVQTFRQQNASGQDRLSALSQALDGLAQAGESLSSANVAVSALVKSDHGLARAIVEHALSEPEAIVGRFAGQALWELFDTDREEAGRAAWRFLASPSSNLHLAAAAAFHRTGESLSTDDNDLFRALLANGNPNVVATALRSVWIDRELPEKERLRLLLAASLGDNARVADDFCMALVAPRREQRSFSVKAAADILAKLEPIPKLEGHWVDVLLAKLSEEHPDATLDFFMRRVETAAAEESFRIRAVNYGPYSHEKLKFSGGPDAQKVFQRLWVWMKAGSAKGVYFQEMAGHLFEAMLGRHEPSIIGLLQPLVPTAGPEEIETITRLIRHAHHRFVLRNAPFVISLLERSREVGAEILKDVTDTVAVFAVSGGRSGVPGEPMPRDLKDEQESADVLRKLSRMSPAYRLYELINKSAKQAIEKSRREGRRLDEMEQDGE